MTTRLMTWATFAVVALVTSDAMAAIKVVATLPTLAAIAAEVGGKDVEVQALASAGEDPHFVEPRPNLLLALNHADLLIANGLELEIGWLPALQVSARNARVQPGGRGYLEAAEFIQPLDVPRGHIERSMGDLHPGGNPHFLVDPLRVAAIAQGLAQRLGELDPTHADVFKKNALDFGAKLRAVSATQQARFKALTPAQRQVVSYHKSLVYLLTWLALEEVATLEARPGVPPDPAHVAAVLGVIRAKKVPAIVQEEFYPTGTSKTLAELGPTHLVLIHGGVRYSRGEHYLDYIKELTDGLYTGLEAGAK